MTIICSHGVRVLAALQSSHHHHHVLFERSNLVVSEAAKVGRPTLLCRHVAYYHMLPAQTPAQNLWVVLFGVAVSWQNINFAAP